MILMFYDSEKDYLYTFTFRDEDENKQFDKFITDLDLPPDKFIYFPNSIGITGECFQN